MKRMIFWVSCFVGLSIFIGECSAEHAEILEQYLPENTLAVCVFPDLEHTVMQFQQTQLARDMISFPQVQQKFSNLAEEMTQQTGSLSIVDLWKIFHRSFAIAFVDVDSARPFEAPSSRNIALLADVTDTDETLQYVLQSQLIPDIQAQEPDVEFLVDSIQGIDVYSVANRQFHIYYTFVKNIFILTFDQATLYAILSAKEHLLTTLPYRHDIMQNTDDPHEIRVYINLQRLWPKLQSAMQQECASSVSDEFPQILHFLNLYQWRSLFWGFSWKESGGYERLSCTIWPEQTRNYPEQDPDLLHTLWMVGNGPLISDRLLPDNIVYYGATRVNVQEMWLHFSRLSRTSPSLRQREQFNNWVKRIEETLQLDISADILAAFGQEVAVAWFPGKFSLQTPWQHVSLEDIPLLFMVQTRDPQLPDQILHTLSTMVQISPDRTVLQDIPIQSLQIPGKSMAYTLHAAVIEGFLAVSFSKPLIQEVIHVSQHGRSLAEAEHYQTALASLPSQEAYSKGYLNITQVARLLRQVLDLQPLVSAGQHEYVALLQEMTRTMEQWPGMMWVTTVVQDGFLTESFSPVGGPVSGLMIGWLGGMLLK